MARTPKTITAPVAEPVLNETALASVGAAPAQLAAIQAGYSEDRDLLNQLLGQAQMADAFAKFSKTVLTSKLAFVKENKLYQQLKGKKTQDGLDFSGTWAEFCNLLGLTPEHANESITNLNQFGSEALESMSSMGIGYRELRQYRKLPEDQKLALIEVAKAGDKEGFVELAEEIIAKHAKEKAALSAELQDVRDQAEDFAASKKVMEGTVADLRKQARRLAHATQDELAAHLRSQAQEVAKGIEAEVLGPLRDGMEQLVAHGEETGRDERVWVKGQLELVLERLMTVAGRMGVELTIGSATPAWLDTSAIPDAAAGAAH